MTKDKYSAVWVSFSSISDFLNCPRAYFLKNVYRDPSTGHKIKLVNPAMSLGSAVHETLEALSVLPVKERFAKPLLGRFRESWQKVSGKRGGFWDQKTEDHYFKRGQEMIKKVEENPGPLKKLAVKISQELPYYWLSEEENIILCGKIDWLEYLPETDKVHVIDFKTGRSREADDSLQLPIYSLLVANCQKREVEKVSYWYLADGLEPVTQKLPNLGEATEKVLKVARKIKLARQLEKFSCPENGCRHCLPMERILRGEGEKVNEDGFNSDVYVLDKKPFEEVNKESRIL